MSVEDSLKARRTRAMRVRRELKIALGRSGGTPRHGAVTKNFSLTGFGVTSQKIYPVGTPLAISVVLPDDQKASAQCVVTWAREAPAGVVGPRGAMGLRLVDADEALRAYVRTTVRKARSFEGAEAVPFPRAPSPAPRGCRGSAPRS